MHVLIVSAWNPTSGVLSVYRSLARHLGPRGVRFSAFAFDGWSADTWWTFCDELIDGREITLAEVLMSRRYDLVHCVDTTYAPPYGVEKWVRRARFRGPVVLMAQQVATRQLSQIAHATRYVACSQAAADLLAQDADGPVRVIPNGYDEEIFKPVLVEDPGRPLLVWVGRSYDPQKGVDLFLDAVEAMPGHDAVLVDADAGEAVETRLRQLGARARHRALLEPHEVAEIYCTAAASGGAFISTSEFEAFGIAAVEAMACCCPVIAPRIPGHEHLLDKINAMVYDRSRGASGIVAAIGELVSVDLRTNLTVRARAQAAQDWTSRAMADAYAQVYDDAIHARSTLRQHAVRDWFGRTWWRVLLSVRPQVQRLKRLARG
jgi:glycosyltransferase involved in cell wall biosynthesis